MFSIAFNLWAGPSGTIDMIRGYSNGTPLDSTFTPTPAARFLSFSLLPHPSTIVCNKIFCSPRASEPRGFDLGPSSDTLPLGFILGDAFGELPAAYKTSYRRSLFRICLLFGLLPKPAILFKRSIDFD